MSTLGMPDEVRSRAIPVVGRLPDYSPFGGFRLLLALLVVLQHAVSSLAPPTVQQWIVPLEVGTIAVYIFFALSGYVIADAIRLNYADRPIAFMANRLLRIVPSYVVALAAVALLIVAMAPVGPIVTPELTISVAELGDWRVVFANAVAIVPFAGSLIGDAPVLIPLVWAVRVELLFYAVVFAAMTAARFFGATLEAITASLGIAVVVLSFALFDRFTGMALENAPFFVFGMALHRLRHAANNGLGHAVAAGLLVSSTILSFGRVWSREEFIGGGGIARSIDLQVLIFLVLLATFVGLSQVRIGISGRLGRLDRALGEVTYPIYLNHLLVIYAATTLWRDFSVDQFLLLGTASVVVSCIVAAPTEPVIAKARDAVRGRRLSAAARG